MKKKLAILLVTIWAISIGIGMVWMTDYSTKPGKRSLAPAELPLEFREQKLREVPKLLVFLHPECPCSRATVAELEKLVYKNFGRFEVRVLFYQPEDHPEWAQNDMWQRASQIPGAKLATLSETELGRFGALTSGQALLYDAENRLVFSGGITPARGHEGDSPGSELIRKYLNGEKNEYSEAPVFGCILTNGE
jgi:hypothetical protein